MIKYIARRILIGFVTLFGISIITFMVIQLAPGDPASMKVSTIQNRQVSKRIYEDLRKYYGLDAPMHVQFWNWVKRLATGDLGNSFHDGEKVGAKIREALFPTISVDLISILLSFSLAVPIGIYSAAKQGGLVDRYGSVLLYILFSIPSYVVGMLLILLIGVKWDLLPFRGMQSDNFDSLGPMAQLWDYAKHYIMITLCYTLGGLAYFSRFVRNNLLETIRQDFVRTARAKGLTESRVVLRHAFRNSLIPLLTLLGLSLPSLIGGSVILETMFNWPGLGRLYLDSVLNRDYPTIMALNFFTAVLVLLGTLLADLAYGLADPRIRYE